MKRVIIIIMVLCVLFNSVNAQNDKQNKTKKQKTLIHNTKMIELNFETKKFTNTPDKINKGDFYQVRINHINMNLFMVQIGSRDTVSGKPLETPLFGNFDLDAFSKLVAGIGPAGTSFAGDKVIQTKSPFNDVLSRIKKENLSISKYTDQIQKIGLEIINLKFDVYKERLNSLKLTDSITNIKIEDQINKVESNIKSIDGLQSQIQMSVIVYEAFYATNNAIIDTSPDLVTRDKIIKESYKNLQGLLLTTLSSITPEKAYELLSPLVLIQNNKPSTYTSLPIQYQGDQVKLKVSIVPREASYNLQTYNTQLVFPRRKWNANIGLSYYISSLVDSAYTTVENKLPDSSSTFKIFKEDPVKTEAGLAALLRYQLKFGKREFWGLHGSIGAGISITNKIRPRFFCGIGSSLGVRHMLAIDGGIVGGYVDIRSNTIDLSKTYTVNPGTVTVSKSHFGYFVALGYMYNF